MTTLPKTAAPHLCELCAAKVERAAKALGEPRGDVSALVLLWTNHLNRACDVEPVTIGEHVTKSVDDAWTIFDLQQERDQLRAENERLRAELAKRGGWTCEIRRVK